MSSKKIKVSLNKNSNEKDSNKPDGDKIILLFVDTSFKDIKVSGKEAPDPLNVQNSTMNFRKVGKNN